MKRVEFLNNIIIDYGILNVLEKSHVNEMIKFIKSDMPILNSILNNLYEEAIKKHDSITVRFSHKNDEKEYRDTVKFGVSFGIYSKTIHIDYENSTYGHIYGLIIELCNACNKELNEYMSNLFSQPYSRDLDQAQIDYYAYEIEKREFISSVRAIQTLLKYLKNNKEEITKIILKEDYQEIYDKLKESLNSTLEDIIKSNPEHIDDYKKSVKLVNELKNLSNKTIFEENSTQVNENTWQKYVTKQKAIYNRLDDKYEWTSKINNKFVDDNINNDSTLIEKSISITNTNFTKWQQASGYLTLLLNDISLENSTEVTGKCEAYVDSLKFEQL